MEHMGENTAPLTSFRVVENLACHHSAAITSLMQIQRRLFPKFTKGAVDQAFVCVQESAGDGPKAFAGEWAI
jgi:hypothetical protein